MSTEREYEDAWAWWPGTLEDEIDGKQAAVFRVAVADGATAASYSRLWARQLVRAAARGRLRSETVSDDLLPLQRSWRRMVGNRPLPWYAEQKREEGAFSALVAIEFRDGLADDAVETPAWSAFAVGDSCFAHIRQEEGQERIVQTVFPLAESAAFGGNPVLLSTRADCSQSAVAAVRRTAGTALSGDTFHVMTDALAQWFLRECEAGESPWVAFQEPRFDEWVNSLRVGRRMRDDDVTLVSINIGT